MSTMTKTSASPGRSLICMLLYVIAFTSVPDTCFPRSNFSPSLQSPNCLVGDKEMVSDILLPFSISFSGHACCNSGCTGTALRYMQLTSEVCPIHSLAAEKLSWHSSHILFREPAALLSANMHSVWLRTKGIARGAHPCAFIDQDALSSIVTFILLHTRNSVWKMNRSSSRKAKSRDCSSCPSASISLHYASEAIVHHAIHFESCIAAE